MNLSPLPRGLNRLRYSLMLRARAFDAIRSMGAFDHIQGATIQRIYVINLDRKPSRWRQVSSELSRLRDRTGSPLISLTRRFSAIDARYLHQVAPYSEVLHPHYFLADQLTVDPIPGLAADTTAANRRIDMSPQEIAVALSHIGVWQQIADADVPYSLVLEDDVYFRRGFIRDIDEAWPAFIASGGGNGSADILYLSFKEAGTAPSRSDGPPVRRPQRGLWQLSGYVLSRSGARRLLDLLPARGPIDLWVNLQFSRLEVLTTRRSIIDQRMDVPSSNSYSILPILAQVGVHTREKPLLARRQNLPGPVFAVSESGCGMSALAMALSMLGYRCCSDLSDLPAYEIKALMTRRRRAFDAYVNIGSLNPDRLIRLADLYKGARFIVVTRGSETSTSSRNLDRLLGRTLRLKPNRVLDLAEQHADKWEVLSKFLGCEYPALPYPTTNEVGVRQLVDGEEDESPSAWMRRLKFDRSPWIVPLNGWRGIRIGEPDDAASSMPVSEEWIGSGLAVGWVLRDDTFPSNLALFRPANLVVGSDDYALELRSELTPVRAFTSAAIASGRLFRYGRFEAVLRPSDAPGLISGMFLHRNEPRQEIDIEFLGRDTTKLLTNVYYNPGVAGAKLEYGYRGSPILIDLGFDAAAEFHRYEIEWLPGSIRWLVDGRLVHERVIWDPTPIPDLAMEFNVNLWHSRSMELAGGLDALRLPARTYIRSVRITQPAASKDAVRRIR